MKTIVLILLAFLLPGAARAESEPELTLACVSPERSMAGSQMTIRCHLELHNRGAESLAGLSGSLADAAGATVAGTRLTFGDLAPGARSLSSEEVTFSFDTAAQEPPRLAWDVSCRDRNKRQQSWRIRL